MRTPRTSPRPTTRPSLPVEPAVARSVCASTSGRCERRATRHRIHEPSALKRLGATMSARRPCRSSRSTYAGALGPTTATFRRAGPAHRSRLHTIAGASAKSQGASCAGAPQTPHVWSADGGSHPRARGRCGNAGTSPPWEEPSRQVDVPHSDGGPCAASTTAAVTAFVAAVLL